MYGFLMIIIAFIMLNYLNIKILIIIINNNKLIILYIIEVCYKIYKYVLICLQNLPVHSFKNPSKCVYYIIYILCYIYCVFITNIFVIFPNLSENKN